MKSLLLGGALIMILMGNVAASSSPDSSPLPKATGPFAVGTVTRTFQNAGAKPERSFRVQFWFPAASSSSKVVDGLHPVLLFFPGWGGEVTDNTSLLRDLASQGYLIAGVSYPQGQGVPDAKIPMQFSSDAAFAEGSAQADRMVHIEADDGSDLLNELARLNTHDPETLFTGHLDLNKVATLGMSLGGSVAAQLAFQDPRVRAVVNLDGWFFADPARSYFSQPYMALRDGMPPPTEADMASHVEFLRHFSRLRFTDARHQDEQLTKHGGYHVVIAGTDHMNFCDKPMYGPTPLTGPINPQRAMLIIQAYVSAFLNEKLEAKNSSLLTGPSAAHPEATLKAFARP